MAEGDMIIEKKEHIGIITFNRPGKRNALTGELIEKLVDTLNRFEKDNEVHVVIIRGEGKAFCAGHDFSDVVGEKSALEYRELFRGAEPIARTIISMGKPVIAAVQGQAFAGGLALAAACDMVIASEDARFGLTGIQVGLACITPAAVVSRSVGRKKSFELLIGEEIIDAREAEGIGLINKVVPRQNLDEAVLALATRIAEKSPIAVQLAKRAFHTMQDMEFMKAVSYASEMLAINATSSDAKAGIACFLDQGKPTK